jgi:hypothetical protein
MLQPQKNAYHATPHFQRLPAMMTPVTMVYAWLSLPQGAIRGGAGQLHQQIPAAVCACVVCCAMLLDAYTTTAYA